MRLGSVCFFQGLRRFFAGCLPAACALLSAGFLIFILLILCF